MRGPDRDLGMDRPITRRDFLNGVAVALTSTVIRPPWLEAYGLPPDLQPDAALDDYPPARTGLRGSHPGSFEVAHRLRDRKGWTDPGVDTAERYDLVVVGGGISGLAAAYFFRSAAGPHARILILDNHDDFGGHAKRNEFRHHDRLLVLNGGTLNIEAPLQYSKEAMGLLRAIGIDLERFEEATAPDRNLYRSLGLGRGVFFNKEKFGTDRLVAGLGEEPWPAWLAKTPLPDAAKRDLTRLERPDQPDYLPGLTSDEKKQRLMRMSYLEFLLQVAKVHPDAAWFYQTRTHGLFCLGIDAVPAYFCWNMGYPGFQGMKLEPTPPDVLAGEPGGQHGRENQERANRGGRAVHFPDGNATIARLLVRALIPDAVPGRTQEDVVTARVNYALLDRPANPTRIRLSSTAVRVRHDGDPATAREVIVSYVTNGRTYSVRGGGCVLACWNFVIPYLCPELPDQQKQALAYGTKQPIVYTNVLLRNWTAFAALKVSSITAPEGYHSTTSLAEPVSLGQYRHPRTPEEPIVIDMHRAPCAPGRPRKEQHRRGQLELLTTTFETFERKIREQLGRMLAAGGFDPARDIEAITVNRWPHGYAYTYSTLWDPIDWALGTPDDRPCIVGRQPFGRIVIANADAAASPHTDAAIDMAYRAVRELLGPGRTSAPR